MMFTPFAFIKQPGGTNVYEILLSRPSNDTGVCAIGPNRAPTFYTTDITFSVNSIIYTNPNLKTPFDGGNFFYSTYDSLQSPYNIYIVINRSGVITANGECK